MAFEEYSDSYYQYLNLMAKPFIAMFSAHWCGPCHKLKPIIKQLCLEYPNINVVYVDIDKFGYVADKYNIESLPTLVLIKDDKMLDSIVSSNPHDVQTFFVKASSASSASAFASSS